MTKILKKCTVCETIRFYKLIKNSELKKVNKMIKTNTEGENQIIRQKFGKKIFLGRTLKFNENLKNK